jgi:hypothetical protein
LATGLVPARIREPRVPPARERSPILSAQPLSLLNTREGSGESRGD